MTIIALDNPEGFARRGDLQAMQDSIIERLQSGEILIPQVQPGQANFAGGVNHCPNSDLNYSELAATVAGTLPGDAGDTNQEAYRFFRQVTPAANLVFDAAHALKGAGHSLYAGDELGNLNLPIWNRVSGWIEMGSTNAAKLSDVAVHLLNKLVGPGETWFFLFRCVALTADIVPADVQLYVGLWQKDGGGEGYAEGSPFDLEYEIRGTPGTTSYNYRALAKTDSGVSILSNILAVADAPNVLSSSDYVKLFFRSAANAGFIEFTIIREDVAAGTFERLFTIRNSTDLQYNDIGTPGQAATSWPAVAGNAPLAYAQTRTLRVGAYGGAWALNELRFKTPPNYDSSATNSDGQSLRFGLTAPTAVARQIGVDRIYFSTTFNEWAPDKMPPFTDGTYPIPSVSPSSGMQGSGDGVFDPPGTGGGGGTCILTTLPVLVRDGRKLRFQRLSTVQLGDEIKGEHKLPYVTILKKTGNASEYYVLKTRNGITYECTADHRLVVDAKERTFIEARNVEVGTRLACWVKGDYRIAIVASVELVPKPIEVGTLSLRHLGSLSRDGEGMYIAGRSQFMDRGLLSSNVKPLLG